MTTENNTHSSITAFYCRMLASMALGTGAGLLFSQITKFDPAVSAVSGCVLGFFAGGFYEHRRYYREAEAARPTDLRASN